MSFQKLALAAITLAAASWLAPSAAFAQSTSFLYIDGKNCPSGFTQSRGMCTASKGDKEGMVKTGRCPSGFTDTGAYCYREVKADKASASGSKSSGSVSQPNPSPNQTFAYKTITARVKKAAEIDLCPTGHFTNRQDISECVTHYSDAPKSRLATSGKCSAGETLERGTYCTSATSMPAQDMDAAITADFNELYTAYGIKHGKVPTLDSKPPEVAAPMLATLNAAKPPSEPNKRPSTLKPAAKPRPSKPHSTTSEANNTARCVKLPAQTFQQAIPPATPATALRSPALPQVQRQA
ncbi:MAG: hypothetical protein HC765_05260 [Brachymonas sp.]|nr:hypothetical protein [Brachymonas sp.]